MSRSRFVKWPAIDGPIDSFHPFWDRKEKWVASDDKTRLSNYLSKWQKDWRLLLHFPYSNRHSNTGGPVSDWHTNALNPDMKLTGMLPTGIKNIWDFDSPHNVSPNNRLTDCRLQLDNQRDIWLDSNKGKIIQGHRWWSIRGTYFGENWIATGFMERGLVSFDGMGIMFDSGPTYTDRQAYDILDNMFSTPMSINQKNI
jgi:hypothetical protein